MPEAITQISRGGRRQRERNNYNISFTSTTFTTRDTQHDLPLFHRRAGLHSGGQHATLPLEPGLLSACCTIRDKAVCIFYAENTFEVRTIDFHFYPDHKLFNRVQGLYNRNRWERIGGRLCLGWTSNFNGNPDWVALKVWLRRVFEDSVFNQYVGARDVNPIASMVDALMDSLFIAVVEMRDAGAAWKAVEKMVDA